MACSDPPLAHQTAGSKLGQERHPDLLEPRVSRPDRRPNFDPIGIDTSIGRHGIEMAWLEEQVEVADLVAVAKLPAGG